MARTELGISPDLLEVSRLPRRFWRYQVKDYTGVPAALRATEKYHHQFQAAQSTQLGLRYFGPPGSSKTFLAVHLARLLLTTGHSVTYHTLDFLTDAYFQRTGDGIAFLTRFEAADLVIFDRLDETLHRGQRIAFNKAVLARSDTGKPYVVCSSLDPEQFATQYGEQAARCLTNDLVSVNCVLSDPFKAEALAANRRGQLRFL